MHGVSCHCGEFLETRPNALIDTMIEHVLLYVHIYVYMYICVFGGRRGGGGGSCAFGERIVNYD